MVNNNVGFLANTNVGILANSDVDILANKNVGFKIPPLFPLRHFCKK
jgi:hypothetical protein